MASTASSSTAQLASLVSPNAADAMATTSCICDHLSSFTSCLSDTSYTTYFLFFTYLGCCMQLDFTMICASSIYAENTMTTMLTNVLDAATASLFYYLFGSPSNGLIGLKKVPSPTVDCSNFLYDGIGGVKEVASDGESLSQL